MERLFFNSLPELMREQEKSFGGLALFSTSYTVECETNFIDILLQAEQLAGKSRPWAIIIEDKIEHHLHNELEKY